MSVAAAIQNFHADKTSGAPTLDVTLSGKLIRTDNNTGIANVIINLEVNNSLIGESISTDSSGAFTGVLRLSVPGTYAVVAVFNGAAVPQGGLPTDPVFAAVFCTLSGAFSFTACPRLIISNVTRKAYRMIGETDRLVEVHAIPTITVPTPYEGYVQAVTKWITDNGFDGCGRDGCDPFDALKDAAIFAVEKSQGWIQILSLNVPSSTSTSPTTQLTTTFQNIGSKDLYSVEFIYASDLPLIWNSTGFPTNTSPVIGVGTVHASETKTISGPTINNPLTSGFIGIHINACIAGTSTCGGNNLLSSGLAILKQFTILPIGSQVFIVVGAQFPTATDSQVIPAFLYECGVVFSQPSGKMWSLGTYFQSDAAIKNAVQTLVTQGKITDIRIVRSHDDTCGRLAINWGLANGFLLGGFSYQSFISDPTIVALLGIT